MTHRHLGKGRRGWLRLDDDRPDLARGGTATLTGGASASGDVSFQLYSDPCRHLLLGRELWGRLRQQPRLGCGGANEEIAVAKASPSISTTRQPASGAVGDTFDDTATLLGGVNPDGTGSITFTRYSAANCGGTVLDQETVSGISVNGDVTTPKGVKIKTAGTY